LKPPDIVGVLVGNLDDGQIMEVNDALLTMVGYSREDLALLRCTDLTPPDWQAARQRAMARLAKHGVCDRYEMEYVRKDGSRVPVLVAAAAIEGPVPQVID
jgi:PAS domain S-box-containing protein